MKSFKVREGKVLVEGVYYSDSPSSNEIAGKAGRIHSINIGGKQFFPYAGQFDDGTTPIVKDETPKVKGKVGKTELVESSSKPVGVDGKPIKKPAKKATK
jgi:hypothetical protein